MIVSVWDYLTSAENRETLTWIGGGISSLAVGIWAVIKFMAGGKKDGGTASEPSAGAPAEILADRNAQASGRDINHNSHNKITINTGVSGWRIGAIAAITVGLVLITISQIGSRVIAENGSSAIGGNVSGSTIIISQ